MGALLKPRRSIIIGALSVEDIEHRFKSSDFDNESGSAQLEILPLEFSARCILRDRNGKTTEVRSNAVTLQAAIAEILQHLASKPVQVSLRLAPLENMQPVAPQEYLNFWRATAQVTARSRKSDNINSDESIDADIFIAGLTASLRALADGNLFAREYRADNQLFLRDTAKEVLRELGLGEKSQLGPRADSIVLSALNRASTAAVVTATNYPNTDRLLQLYDTASWLYDSNGQRRLQNTESKLWLAWFPGFTDDHRTVREVIESMPSVPDVAIPAIIRLMENPKSWVALPGAMSLKNHDILHVLLGRGLQDQDEAFVLGFAMGSTKKRMWLRRKLFRTVVSRWYPEPYRIHKPLLPAFELGFQAGQKTGDANLSKRDLTELLDMTIAEARQALQIDPEFVRDAFVAERLAIPLTMASLRLDI